MGSKCPECLKKRTAGIGSGMITAIDEKSFLAISILEKVEGWRMTPTENAEQAALFQWAELASGVGHIPNLRLLHSIPNGGP